MTALHPRDIIRVRLPNGQQHDVHVRFASAEGVSTKINGQARLIPWRDVLSRPVSDLWAERHAVRP